MSIFPLPVFETDADPHNRDAMSDEEIYARLSPPDSLVVKFGSMKLIAELPYSGDVRPGCGTKLIARTHRGTEVVEMLTTTCENAGCNKSITRKEMLEYIENSGGADYPFHAQGQVLRVATIEDLNRMSVLRNQAADWTKMVKAAAREHNLDMRIVDVEPILGEEVLTIYFTAEDRVDFRDLVRELAGTFKTRIEMRHVGARDEARLIADYERCGQHCCCKQFLKVLKPVSMRAAKVQKATLDPLKISGRCGRLMCCLRYEDKTYRELKQALPNRKSRVGTRYGPGIVQDSKILVQLVLIRLEHNNEEVAIPVEELVDPETCPQPGTMNPQELAAFQAKLKREELAADDPLRGMDAEEAQDRGGDQRASDAGQSKRHRGRDRRRPKEAQQDAYREKSKREETSDLQQGNDAAPAAPDDRAPPPAQDRPREDPGGKKKRRRRRKGGKGRSGGGEARQGPPGGHPQSGSAGSEGGGGDKSSAGGPKRRRRRGGKGRRKGKRPPGGSEKDGA